MHHFFAYMSRMKLIRRWSLMRNLQPENDAEHSLQVAMIAHALAVMARDRYGRAIDPDHITTLAIYHDATEVLTGDLPTPVKYHSDTLRSAYGQMESLAGDLLLSMLPQDLQKPYTELLIPHKDDAYQYVKIADRISAYVKCL